MNIALSLLSQSGETNVIDRLQGYAEAAEQVADPDYWSSVGIISLTGILVVFLILAILIFFFWLMGTVFKAVDKKRAAKKAVKAEPAPAKPAPAVETAEEDDMEEIVAVISAAVAAYAEAEGASYTIRSIKRRSDNRARSAWSVAGIMDNMQKF